MNSEMPKNTGIDHFNFSKLFPADVFTQKNVFIVHRIGYNIDHCMVGIIHEDDPTLVDVGFSYCSYKDQYNKKTAREIAYTRAFFTPYTYSLSEMKNKLEEDYFFYNGHDDCDLVEIVSNLIYDKKINFYDIPPQMIAFFAIHSEKSSFVHKTEDFPKLKESDKEWISIYESLV